MAACFAELTTTRSDQISVESIGMEEAQGNYHHPDESRGMDAHWALKEQTPMDMEKKGMKT